MDRTDVLNRLTTIFRKVLENEQLVLTNELTANDVEQWDSLTHMLLIATIEEEFSVKFKLKELNKMKNVGDLVDITISKF